MQNNLNDLIYSLRWDYLSREFDEKDADVSPFRQFEEWMEEAIKAEVMEPNAVTLATATKDGKPTARVVLLRGFDENGFVFFTNYQSRKGRELLNNPYASLNFYWPELARQVRVDGIIEKITAQESDDYFASRPRDHQIGSWASEQSNPAQGREELERKVKEVEQRYEGTDVSRPPYWGGFRVIPREIEFWQGRVSRLHDRIRYRKNEKQEWLIERLFP